MHLMYALVFLYYWEKSIIMDIMWQYTYLDSEGER